MITITLPDGSARPFPRPGDGGRSGRVHRPRPGQGGAGRPVDGKLVDTSHRIEADAQLAIVTDKDPDGLEVCATRRRTCWPMR
jgi:threonyl-tRNA synthetase